MGQRCFKHVAMLLGVHRHNLRLKAKKLRLLMEQPTDPATPEEFSKFAEERCLFAEIFDLKRDNAIWVEQSRRDCLDEVQSFSIWALADLSEGEAHFSPGY